MLKMKGCEEEGVAPSVDPAPPNAKRTKQWKLKRKQENCDRVQGQFDDAKLRPQPIDDRDHDALKVPHEDPIYDAPVNDKKVQDKSGGGQE